MVVVGFAKRRQFSSDLAYAAEPAALLTRFKDDAGAIAARLFVRDESGGATLLLCTDTGEAWPANGGMPTLEHACTREVNLDELDGEALVLTATFGERARLPVPARITTEQSHPATAAYFRAWWRGQRSSARCRDLATALDRSEHGWVLLDDRQHVLWANDEAERLFTSSGAIARSGQTIAAPAMSTTVRIRTAIARLCRRSDGDSSFEVIMLPRTGGERPLTLMISTAAQAKEQSVAAVVLQIVDPETDLRMSISRVGRALCLSHAECNIASEVLEGYSVAQAAERASIKTSTARSHLKSVFIKMQVSTQAELVRVFLRSSPSIPVQTR